MFLSAISLANYKPFRDQQLINVRPITVLIGRNSSGKSVLARLPLLIGRCLSDLKEGALELEFDGLDFGESYLDLISNQNPHGAVQLGASFETDANSTLTFVATLQHYNEYNLLLVERFQLVEEGGRTITLRWAGAHPLSEGSKYVIEETQQACSVAFSGLFPAIMRAPDGETGDNHSTFHGFDDFLNSTGAHFADAARKIVYLGPFRESPKRNYRFSGGPPRTFGFAGTRAPELLGDDVLRRRGAVLGGVGDWFAAQFGGWRLDLSKHGNTFSLVLKNPAEPNVEVNLVDVGTGMAQVLPIVVQRYLEASSEPQTGIEIVEQPELHLHPAAHGALADLYVTAAKNHGFRYIIETHSENFILRLRRRIAQGWIDPSSVIIYWVDDTDPLARRVQPIRLDERGEVDGWPEGVFSEDFREVREIRRAQRERPA